MNYGFKQLSIDHYEGHGVAVKMWEDEDRRNRYTVDSDKVNTIGEILEKAEVSVVAIARGRVNRDIEIPVFKNTSGEYYFPESRVFIKESDAVREVFLKAKEL